MKLLGQLPSKAFCILGSLAYHHIRCLCHILSMKTRQLPGKRGWALSQASPDGISNKEQTLIIACSGILRALQEAIQFRSRIRIQIKPPSFCTLIIKSRGKLLCRAQWICQQRSTWVGPLLHQDSILQLSSYQSPSYFRQLIDSEPRRIDQGLELSYRLLNQANHYSKVQFKAHRLR